MVGEIETKGSEVNTKLGIKGHGRIYREKAKNLEGLATLHLRGDQHICPANRLAKIHGARKSADIEMFKGCAGGNQRLLIKLLGLIEKKENVTNTMKKGDQISA